MTQEPKAKSETGARGCVKSGTRETGTKPKWEPEPKLDKQTTSQEWGDSTGLILVMHQGQGSAGPNNAIDLDEEYIQGKVMSSPVDTLGHVSAAAAKSLQSCPTLCDPIERQPTRLPHPWDSPGKNTGVGCHFLLQCMKVKSESEVTQPCPTLAILGTAAYQAPPSMGFSRQEHWIGVPLPSPMHESEKCLTLSDPMDCSLPGSSVHGIFQATVLEWGPHKT